jgi:hypothetical protein
LIAFQMQVLETDMGLQAKMWLLVALMFGILYGILENLAAVIEDKPPETRLFCTRTNKRKD